LPVSGLSSALLIGKNGTGKSTVGRALEVLQKIARRTNRVGDLVKPKDFSRGRSDVPMRFEIEIELQSKVYAYSLAFELPEGFKELRVLEEKLLFDGKPVYTREVAHVHLMRAGKENHAGFLLDWHLVALPTIQEQSTKDPLFIFKQCLARMLILKPIPDLIKGDSLQETLEPDHQVVNFGPWFAGLLAHVPSAYTKIDSYLKQLLPDFKDIKNPLVGEDYRRLIVQFSNENGILSLPFEDLSDGEKCFMICALVLASNEAYGPLICFWDEPDNHLSLSEVGHFMLALRSAFRSGSQFIATSHNSEAIRRFSNENTLVLYRKNHHEPTIVRRLNELRLNGDLISTLIRDDLEL
jgi:predicted ATPase